LMDILGQTIWSNNAILCPLALTADTVRNPVTLATLEPIFLANSLLI
jgi:hypothetical protein